MSGGTATVWPFPRSTKRHARSATHGEASCPPAKGERLPVRSPHRPHRRLVPSGFDRSANAALCVLSAAAAAFGAVPAAAAPSDDSRTDDSRADDSRADDSRADDSRADDSRADDSRAEADRLYEEAERATEAYNKSHERADALREEIATAQDRIARQRGRVNDMRESLGSLAGAQYRSGGIDPSVALLLSEDPDGYLAKATALDRVNAHRAGELKDLQHALRLLAQQREEATGKLERTGAEPQGHRPAQAHRRAETRQGPAAARLPPGRRACRLRPGLPHRPLRPARPRGHRRGQRPRGRRRRRGPLRPRQAVRVGRQRARRLRLFGPHPVVVRPGRRRTAAHLAGPAVRRPAGPAVRGARPATWSSTGPTPATSACTWATAR